MPSTEELKEREAMYMMEPGQMLQYEIIELKHELEIPRILAERQARRIARRNYSWYILAIMYIALCT